MTPILPVPPLVLVFAASDPSCGAGIHADILTLSSLGCHPLAVITALTVQDTVGVESVHPVDSETVERQARSLLEDMPVAAFKVGVLGSVENVVAVAEIVADYPDIPLVLDPVLASGRGDEFANEDLRAAMKELLLPQCSVVTPNTLEGRRLVEEDGDEEGAPEEDLSSVAARLLAYGPRYVLLTGAHEQTSRVTNSLYGEDGLIRQDHWERLPGSYHGSGCTLASAIAACLAGGYDIGEAVREAQEYTWQTLAHGFRPGMGQFIPDRLFWARGEAESSPEDG
ncbi:MAG: hydroxymethylpyrimidine/phosphomethylpyrimidine kinase [Azovibrio sp.]|uniref:bifunctional hydroxymethylpyrimidine kinase/phosphomethylpyrimidine kinase n=1 Tax=Azovibrio sp. TaxID=1872673 RepID=UPI003C712B66